jgi:hypothetical protein
MRSLAKAGKRRAPRGRTRQCRFWVKDCPSDYVGSTSGVRPIAADFAALPESAALGTTLRTIVETLRAKLWVNFQTGASQTCIVEYCIDLLIAPTLTC